MKCGPRPSIARRFASVSPWVNLLVLSIFLLRAISSLGQQTPPHSVRLPILTRVEEVRRLPTEQAQLRLPVRLRAVVTYFEGHHGNMFIQDVTGGIYVRTLHTQQTVARGDLLILEGVTAAPDFAPQIANPVWKVVGRAPMPAPRRVSFQEMASTGEDNQWVEIEGVVRSASVSQGRLSLDIATDSGRLKALVPGADQDAIGRLVDARVRVRGACGAKFNHSNQIVGVLLFVPGMSDIYIAEAAPPDPYGVPVRSIASIMQFFLQARAGHRARVSGVVTFGHPGTGLFIKDGTKSIFVQAAQLDPVAAGDRVDVIGFPALGEYEPILEDAVFRKVGAGPAPQPVRVTPEQVVTGGFNNQLIKIDGRLLDSTLLFDSEVLILQSGPTKFDAFLSDLTMQRKLDTLQPGSKLQLTGICEMENSKEVSRFKLFLRSPQDIVVLERPSWWNLSHALSVTAIMGSLFLVVFGWAATLRRRVSAQTGVLLGRLQRIATLEERYRLLFERNLAGVYSSTMDGQILDCNPAFERLVGCSSRAEVLARGAGDFYFDSSAQEAIVAALAKDKKLSNIEVCLRRQDGSPVWGLGNMTMIDARDGDPAQILGSTINITERKRVEEALRQSEEKTRLIVDTALDAVVTMDSDGLITGWSAQAEKVFGWSREEAIGRLLSDLIIPPQHREAHQRGLRDFQDTGTGAVLGRRIEITALHRDGREFPVELSISPHKLGGVWVFSAFVRDITERKRTQAELHQAKEAAECANRAKSEFLAIMSHEIRTPLNGIIGMTELAMDAAIDPEQQEYLGMVKASGDSLLTVINDILDFSKIEAGKLDLEAIEIDLRSNLASVMKTLSLRASEKGLELAYHVNKNIPAILLGDPGRLRQVLLNLVGNAIKFTEHGEVIVHVEAESRTEDALMLHYSVADTGLGIPIDKQELIFEAFAQNDSSTTRKYGGTGLGLAISDRLVSMMGGRMWVESQLGKGSTFHFTARVGIGVQEWAANPAAAEVSEPLNLKNHPVLVVDDNSTNRRILADMLASWEMIPTLAESGAQALECLERARRSGLAYPLVLLGAQMPDMNGFALAKQIKQDPGLAGATIMMLTSGGQQGDAARCLALGISVYLTKPIRQSDLLEAIIRVAGHGTGKTVAVPLITRHTIRESQRHFNILLAEDNAVNQLLAVRLLEKQGHKVVVAENGLKTLAALEKSLPGQFDLLLMDIQMPEMDGFEVTSAIREQEKATGAHMPILAMTANAMQGDREKCLKAGMDGYISKPVQVRQLLTEIDRVVPLALPGKGPAGRAAASVLDRDALLARLEGDSDLLEQLAALSLADCPRLLAEIHSAVNRRDSRGLERAAHTLRGSLSNFNPRAALAAVKRLENISHEHGFPELDEACAALDEEMKLFSQALQELKGQLLSQAKP